MQLKSYGNGQVYYRNLLMGLMGKKRKISHVLATDYCHESIQHNFSMKLLLPEMTNLHELTLLMSFKVINLKTAGKKCCKPN